MHSYALTFLTIFIVNQSPGQFFPATAYPDNLFRNPLAIPISLAANFGELRSNHYHMGLDIRTAHHENLPVYAAADGYVCRVKIEPFGFGQAIYLCHAGKYQTVYAHLNTFYPALAAWVKQKQYEKQRWEISLDPPPDLFKVRKGDVIAYSGNTGGSQGPHLHFEIRSWPEDVNLNPLLFGLPVADRTPPVVKSLSVYDRNSSFYEQSPVFVAVNWKSGKYSLSLPELICKTPNPGFGIVGFDTQTGSNNPNGIYEGVIYDNGRPVSGFQMNRISYNETQGINAHIDYPTHAGGGPYYQLLFRMPGYDPSIYHESPQGGRIHLEDGKQHVIRIEIQDAVENKTSMEFRIRYLPASQQSGSYPGKMFYPGMVDVMEATSAAFYLGEGCLYDSLHLNYLESTGQRNDMVSSLHQFGSSKVPLADAITVRIKLTRPVNQKQKVLMLWSDGDEYEIAKPTWLDDWATAAFRKFGSFCLVLDTVPPVILVPGISENANLKRSSRIAVFVQDNFKKIKNFRGTLDGKWLLFSNDKSKAFIYHFDEHCQPGKHEMKIYAEDEAGNGSALVFHFTR